MYRLRWCGIVVATISIFMLSCGGDKSPAGPGKQQIQFINDSDEQVHITLLGTPHDFDLEPHGKATKEVAVEGGSTRFTAMIKVLLQNWPAVTKSEEVCVGQKITIRYINLLTIDKEPKECP